MACTLALMLAGPQMEQACDLLRPHLEGAAYGHIRPAAKEQSPFEQPRKPPEKVNRIVADAASVLQHLAAARNAQRPRSDVSRHLEPDLFDAIAHVASFAMDPMGLQQERFAILKDIQLAKRLVSPITKAIHEWLPAYAKPVAGLLDIGLLEVFKRVTGWCDEDITQNVCLGFSVLGDCKDSGVFRECVKERLVDPETFDMRAHMRDQQHVMETSASRWSAKRLADELVNWDKSLEETMITKDNLVAERWARGPFSEAEVLSEFPNGVWSARRFCIDQGGKHRVIDDCKDSGLNDACGLQETIHCESAEFPAKIAARFYELLGSGFGLQGGTEDWTKAYRQILVRDREAAVVAQVNPHTRKVVYFLLHGHSFGQVAAVPNFNRVAKFMTMVTRRLLNVPCGNYFDDGVIVEPTYMKGNGQFCYLRMHQLLGFQLDIKKHVKMSNMCAFLGVVTDFSHFTSGYLNLRVKPGRAENILSLISDVLASGQLKPGMCDRLQGKLYFVCTTVFGRVGRAALQPIIWGKKYKGHNRLPVVIREALHFFVALLNIMGLMPRRINLRAQRRRPLLVWSDASYENGVGLLGFVIYDPDTQTWYHSSRQVPRAIIESFIKKKQYIGQCEILAAVCVYFTLPDLCRDREIIHWIDNESAIQGLKNGYSPKGDSAKLIHAFHMFNAGLKADVWFEYVESEANVADAPSRNDFEMLEMLGSTFYEMVIPEVADFYRPLGQWFFDATGERLNKRVRSSVPSRTKRARKRARGS